MKRSVCMSFIVFALLSFSRAYASEVTAFTFITEPQVVLPGVLSKQITIQSQNSSGISEPIAETFDLVLTSSSPTGVFLSSTGKSVSKTMSRNTSNKNFYYKDDTKGDFVISVTATGRDSKKSFGVTQHILVGEMQVVKKKDAPVVAEIVSSSKILKTDKKEVPTASSEASTSEIVLDVFTAEKKQGFIGRILSLPTRIWVSFTRMFIEK